MEIFSNKKFCCERRRRGKWVETKTAVKRDGGQSPGVIIVTAQLNLNWSWSLT
jgi:hypothetical protein